MNNRAYWSFLIGMISLFSSNCSSVPLVKAIKNIVSTNHKPKFEDCTTYESTLEEQQPPGTPVLRVNASDPDEDFYEVSVSKDMPVNCSVATIPATNIDENDNSSIKYEIVQENDDSSYFDIGEHNGLLALAEPIDRDPGQYYSFHVRAYNVNSMENNTQQADVKVIVRVVDSDKRAPYFIKMPTEPVMLNETFKDYNKILAEFQAVSNNGKGVIFEIVQRKSIQTNSENNFWLEQIDDMAHIKLGKTLDYETATEYTLTVRVTNSLGQNAEVFMMIIINDENDNIPYFVGEDSGTILEHELPGTFVMQVHARDDDGTASNNIVSYRLDHAEQQYFQIDSQSGIITSLVEFDRATQDAYMVVVIAEDNSPSVLFHNGKPNYSTQGIFIKILPRNEFKPQFEEKIYGLNYLPENATINTEVIKVKAIDRDKYSTIKYSIAKNNVANAFKIDEDTGMISVNNQLDYERIPHYKLIVKADDGLFYDTVPVRIIIGNVNDIAPKFIDLQNVTIREETIPPGCIANVLVYDPDIKNFVIAQDIRYTLPKEQEHLLAINASGCLRLLKPLDRDPPHGSKLWQIKITATDENGKGKDTTETLNITLEDINDNAPYLTNSKLVVWGENRPPGMIAKLTAEDADEEQNGPPFVYSIDPEAPWEIKQRFQIVVDELHALIEFDREDTKEYKVPILISDSGIPPMSSISTLQIVIGDENDNKMQQGESHIVMYKLHGKLSDIKIGRVYVNDSDDWDLSNKTFNWDEATSEATLKLFKLNPNTGLITMLEGTPCGQYDLGFQVTESSTHFSLHNVSARVIVLVKEISRQSIDQSGSIRFYNVTADEFVSETPGHPSSPFHRLQTSIATILNTNPKDVNIFTINNRKLAHDAFLDVFFAVNGSVYSTSELLNGVLSYQVPRLEKDVGFPIEKIGIDECDLQNRTCEQSCRNKVYTSPKPIVVNAAAASFIGISSFVQAECISDTLPSLLTCLNGGTIESNSCICRNGFEGPQCEMIDISFDGNGYAIYPSIISGNITNIGIEILPQQTDGLVLYIGPISYNPRVQTQPFLALEIIDGTVVLLLDYGTGTIRIKDQQVLAQDDSTTVDISFKQQSIEMKIVTNKRAISTTRYEYNDFSGSLNTHGHAQLGGTVFDLKKLGTLYTWTYVPQTKGFHGCLRNLTINGRTIDFQPMNLALNFDLRCKRLMKKSRMLYWLMVICTLTLVIVKFIFEKKKKKFEKLVPGIGDRGDSRACLHTAGPFFKVHPDRSPQ